MGGDAETTHDKLQADAADAEECIEARKKVGELDLAYFATRLIVIPPAAMDISSDLTELGHTPVAVVCAGAKSILDIGLTLEYLVRLARRADSSC